MAPSAPVGLSAPLGSALQPADNRLWGEACADLGGFTTAGLENIEISDLSQRGSNSGRSRHQPSVLEAREIRWLVRILFQRLRQGLGGGRWEAYGCM